MIKIRKNRERGKSTRDWLNSFHTFSFSEYHDSQFMGFGTLRVINEDTVLPSNGFGRHPHRDMEIISYVVEGELAHKDSIGNGSVIKPGEIQVMSAGSGIEHSEFNYSKTSELHFLQIWIIPDTQSLKPSYQQKEIKKVSNQLVLIGSKAGDDSSIIIHQDMYLYVAYLKKNHHVEHHFHENRMGWIQLIKGEITLNGNALFQGDGAAIKNEKTILIGCQKDAEFLLFDLKEA